MILWTAASSFRGTTIFVDGEEAMVFNASMYKGRAF